MVRSLADRTFQPRFDVKPSPATFGTLLKAYGAKNDVAESGRLRPGAAAS